MIVGTIAIIIAYLLGSIPFGLLVTKYKAGIDITTKGSGNIGATNVVRVCGKKLGMITFALDALKGVIAVWIAGQLGGEGVQSLAGLTVVLGHIYPCWLNFKGGKGVATAIAVFGALYWPLMVCTCLVWAAIFWLSRISSLSSLGAMLLSMVIAWVFAPGFAGVVCAIISVVVIYRHKDNIVRLLQKEEMQFKNTP